jgi:hypothetical protein
MNKSLGFGSSDSGSGFGGINDVGTGTTGTRIGISGNCRNEFLLICRSMIGIVFI